MPFLRWEAAQLITLKLMILNIMCHTGTRGAAPRTKWT